ncbi:hypothetical protein B0H12DRAFT_1242623 [Mycena haematopus]|nr:hypothetical protein B0H12DRAFT_1242623 [Mycena haematopus]
MTTHDVTRPPPAPFDAAPVPIGVVSIFPTYTVDSPLPPLSTSFLRSSHIADSSPRAPISSPAVPLPANSHPTICSPSEARSPTASATRRTPTGFWRGHTTPTYRPSASSHHTRTRDLRPSYYRLLFALPPGDLRHFRSRSLVLTDYRPHNALPHINARETSGNAATRAHATWGSGSVLWSSPAPCGRRFGTRYTRAPRGLKDAVEVDETGSCADPVPHLPTATSPSYPDQNTPALASTPRTLSCGRPHLHLWRPTLPAPRRCSYS